MSPEDHCSVAALTGAQSRRIVLHVGGALLAGMGVVASQRSAAGPGHTNRSCAGRWLAPGTEFQPGQSLPNTGRCGRCPYTVILWDAADRGFFFADWTGGVAESFQANVLAGIGTAAPPWAVLVGAATEENDSATPAQGVWALSLVYGSLGSDPGAVTYQVSPWLTKMRRPGSAPRRKLCPRVRKISVRASSSSPGCPDSTTAATAAAESDIAPIRAATASMPLTG